MDELPATKLRALIAEDDPNDAEILISSLTGGGYEVIADIVDDSEEFQDRIRKRDYDIVFTDHNMRDWTGKRALELLRQVDKNTPIIVVTASLGDEAAVDYIKEGATDYVLKHHLDRLPLAVARALKEKNYKDALRQAEGILQSLVEASPLAIIALDLQGTVLLWNPAARRIFGWEEAEVLGQPDPTVPDEAMQDFQSLFHRLASEETLTTVQVLRERKDTSRIVIELSAAPFYRARGEIGGVMEVLTDITERRSLEAQLQQAQKMEAVGRLAGGVAHDFNNLLTIILGHGQLMGDYLPEESPLRNHVAEIRMAGERAAGLTKQLLAFSRKQVLQPRVLDINSIITNTQIMLQRLIGEDIELLTSLPSDLGQVKADLVQIEQIILNLAVNARDAMQRGGKLVIETKNIEIAASESQRAEEPVPGKYVLLRISDTGQGIDSETLTHIFEPFFTTKGEAGTGLGLSTVYGIVKLSGGFISVDSEPLRGTTFAIYLPRISAPVTEIQTHDSKTLGGNQTILLMEDDVSLRQLAKTALEGRGYKVFTPTTTDEALALSREHGLQIDLLITDVIMPGHSGPELAEHILKNNSAMRVLFMSGYTDDMVARHKVDGSKFLLLEKPFTLDSLARRVHEALQASPPSGRTILVVDDDERVRSFACGILDQAGHHVLTAANGVDACRFLSRLPFDIVLMDLVMPYKDGIDLIAKIRQDWPAITIIGISSIPTTIEDAGMHFSNVAILPKPLKSEDLVDLVKRIELS
jgi:PAS domain S-box-containing protein